MPEWPATNIQIHRQCCRSWPLSALIFVRPEPEMNTCIAFLLGPYIFFCRTRLRSGLTWTERITTLIYTLVRLASMARLNERVPECVCACVLVGKAFSRRADSQNLRLADTKRQPAKPWAKNRPKKNCERRMLARPPTAPEIPTTTAHPNPIGKPN